MLDAGSSDAPLEKFDTLAEYANHLLSCGKQLFHKEQYEGALQAFMHSISVLEQPGQSLGPDELEWRGAMLHNLASCLHHLHELDSAIAYYELAIASFRHADRLLAGIAAMSPAMQGFDTVNKRRIHFVNQRLHAIRLNLPPDTHNYMDSDGVQRRVHFPKGAEADAAAVAATVEVAATAGSAPALLFTVPNALRPRLPRSTPVEDGSGDETLPLLAHAMDDDAERGSESFPAVASVAASRPAGELGT